MKLVNSKQKVKAEWVECPMFEGIYEVSNTGFVRRSAPRKRRIKDYFPDGKPLKGSLCTKGYPQVSLHKDGKSRTLKVHRLVALAFLGPRPKGLTVNHKDGIKSNNHIGNLEYVTNSQNIKHAFNLGLIKAVSGEKASNPQKLNKEKVISIRERVSNGEARKLIADEYGIHVMTVGEIVRKEIWKWVA